MRIKRMQLSARGLCFTVIAAGGPAEPEADFGGFASGRRSVYGQFTAGGS